MIEYNYRGVQLTDQSTAAGLSIPKLGKSFCLIADQLHCRALGRSENILGTRPFDEEGFVSISAQILVGGGELTPLTPSLPLFRRSCLPSWSARVYDTAQFKIKAHYFYFFFQLTFQISNSCTFLKFLHQLCKLISNVYNIGLADHTFLNIYVCTMFLGLLNFSLFLISSFHAVKVMLCYAQVDTKYRDSEFNFGNM
jgi:hypothetical protein